MEWTDKECARIVQEARTVVPMWSSTLYDIDPTRSIMFVPCETVVDDQGHVHLIPMVSV